ITSRLGQISRLGVLSRTTALHYKNTSLPLSTVASELGVQYVLEGSVRWERGLGGASRVRVTPQLIRVSDDTHLWTDRYDAVLADIFQLQGQIARKVPRAPWTAPLRWSQTCPRRTSRSRNTTTGGCGLTTRRSLSLASRARRFRTIPPS